MLWLLLCLIMTCSVFADQDVGIDEVILKENQSLRELAEEYLGAANDWEIILKYNGYDHPRELFDGARLRIPVQLYQRVTRLIDSSLTFQGQANREGAGILQPVQIRAVKEKIDAAIDLKQSGDLDAAVLIASEAKDLAEAVLKKTLAKRLQAVSAILDKKQGTVQYSRSLNSNWNEAALKQELIEKDHLRTLSRSWGNVLFVDGSRLHMDENALVVIEGVQKDVLRNASSADILVLEGDVSAWLESLSSKNNFRVTSPGIETQIRSRNFFTSRDREKVVRVSNFEGEIDVKSKGAQVTLTQNKGTRVNFGEKPSPPKTLPQPPQFLSPADGSAFYHNRIPFKWNNAGSVYAYQIQISRNSLFTEIEKTARVTGDTLIWPAPGNGIYYWRIRSIDEDGLPGPYTESIEFSIRVDQTPPFLLVNSPEKDTVITTREIRITGSAEKDASLTIDGVSVPVQGDGFFSYDLTLDKTHQIVPIIVTDQAGNQSQALRDIHVVEGGLVQIETADPLFSKQTPVVFKGVVQPGVKLQIDNKSVPIHKNRFVFSLDLKEGQHSLSLVAESPEGETETRTLTVRIDTTPPDLVLNRKSAFTKISPVMISGRSSEPADLFVNRIKQRLDGLSFNTLQPLQPGNNSIEFKLVDQAGNWTQKNVQIVLDVDPPDIGTASVSQNKVTGGEMIDIRISANDAGAGLARTGSFIVTILPETVQLSGPLTRDTDSHDFLGRVLIPPGKSGTLQLKEVRISDYLGNLAVYPE